MEETKAEKGTEASCIVSLQDSVPRNLSDLVPQSGHISRGAFLQLEMLRLFQPDVLSILEQVTPSSNTGLYIDPFSSEHGAQYCCHDNALPSHSHGMLLIETGVYYDGPYLSQTSSTSRNCTLLYKCLSLRSYK